MKIFLRITFLLFMFLIFNTRVNALSITKNISYNGSFLIMVNNIETNEANVNEIVNLKSIPNKKYVLLNWKVYNIEDKNEIIDVDNNSFIMPDFNVVIEAKFIKSSEMKENIYIVDTKTNISSEVDKITKKSISDNSMIHNNSLKNIFNSIDLNRLGIETDEDVIISIEKIIKSINDKQIIYDTKLLYSVNGEETNRLENKDLNGNDIKIIFAIPNDTKETYVNLVHKEGEVIIDTKEYRILENAQGDKYIEIETPSFSTFEINFYTPDNPPTLDNIGQYIASFIFSLSLIIFFLKIKKNI